MSFWVFFLMARTVPPSFVENGKKLRVLILVIGEWPGTAKSRGELLTKIDYHIKD